MVAGGSVVVVVEVVVVVLDGSVVVVAGITVVVVVPRQGFGSHAPAPRLTPPAALHASASSSWH
jgi:hypothetical protein